MLGFPLLFIIGLICGYRWRAGIAARETELKDQLQAAENEIKAEIARMKAKL